MFASHLMLLFIVFLIFPIFIYSNTSHVILYLQALPNTAAPALFMRITGLEPARRRHQILNLARLPIPPYPQIFLIRQKTETRNRLSSI